MATATTTQERDMKTIHETSLMIEVQNAMKLLAAADKKCQAAFRRANRAQSTEAYARIIANSEKHQQEWSKWNAECNRIGVALRQLRATLEEVAA